MQGDRAGDAGGEGGAAADAELGICAREMRADGGAADSEPTANRTVAESLRLQHGNLQLTGRQQLSGCLRTSLHASIMRPAPHASALAKSADSQKLRRASYNLATRADPSERV